MPAAPICFSLPWPRTEKLAREFKKEIQSKFARMPAPMVQRVHVSVLVFPPDNRRISLQPILRSLLTALRDSGIYDDEEQVDVLHIQKQSTRLLGRLKVTVSEVPYHDPQQSTIDSHGASER